MHALVVCHAGAGIGLGHLTRSLVAARAVRDHLPAEVRLLVQGDAIDAGLVSEFTHNLLPFDADLSGAIRALHEKQPASVILLDVYPGRIPADFDDCLFSLHASGCKIVAIDAPLLRRKHLDLIFIPSFRCPPGAESAGNTPVVFGWDCLLLNVGKEVRPWSPGNRILALTGGSDATGLGRTWPTRLNEQLPDCAELDWVVGPFAAPPVWPEKPRIAIHPHAAPHGLGSLMSCSNYAVTVFGVSFYELLYYGIPTVVFSPYDSKDKAELDEIAAEGVAWVAKDERDATELLVQLMHDAPQATSLSRRAREKLANAGGRTLVKEIQRLPRRHNG